MKKDTLKEIEKATMLVIAGVPPWLAERLQKLTDLATPEAELLADWLNGRLRDENGEAVEFSPGAFGAEVMAGGYDTERAKEALLAVGVDGKEDVRDFERGVEVENRWAWGEIDEETYKRINEEFQKRWQERLERPADPEHAPKRSLSVPGR